MAVNVSVQEALSIARRHYDLQVTAQALPSESDANFALTDENGKRFVLKVTPGGDSSALIDCQNAVLGHLAGRFPGEKIPHLLPTSGGDPVARVVRDREEHTVRLVSFVEGMPLAQFLPHSSMLMNDLGGFVGSLDRALMDFDHAGAHRSFEWRMEDAVEVLADTPSPISNPTDRGAVERVLGAFEKNVTPHTGELRSSVIHGDCNDYNVLVDADALTSGGSAACVAGVIDFGDLSHSWTISELAIVCAYALMDKPQPLSVLSRVVGGYHRILPLSAPEMRVLPDLIQLRLAVSLTLAARNARRHPENSYLQISQRPARQLLHRLSEVDAGDFHRAVRRACPRSTRLQAAISRPDAAPAGEDHQIESALQRRKKRIGPSLSLSYTVPLKIVRGRGQYLYDQRGRRYLDCVNNVSHVGHCHPRVVEAADAQMRLLNTNTRYLHDTILDYAERLLDTLPDPLQVCYFVCTGSEANELALRLARAHTGHRGVIVVDGAYHGNTAALIDISPYKFEGRGGAGQAEHVFKTSMPDRYRGPFPYSDALAGKRFATHISDCIAEAERSDAGIAAFICEAVLGCGGQVVPPPGYLKEAFRYVTEAGGVCIADEVQVGFGRVGSRFWGFELQDVVPDIVTMGKPMGNGHPVAAVVTTREIADSFHNGMEYFNTFGGNPVSCAVGLAVLDVIESEDLQEHARKVGSELKRSLSGLHKRFPLIGDVRGEGLFLGLELVTDSETLQPAPHHATYLVERMRQLGILLSTDGPLHNVIKIKPPLVFDSYDAERLVDCLGEVLKDTVLQVGSVEVR